MSIRILVLSMSLLLWACAIAPPVQEMSDARQAVLAAREADAARYAGTRLDTAQTYLDLATSKLEAGAYAQARRFAVKARQEAQTARDMAVKAKGVN